MAKLLFLPILLLFTLAYAQQDKCDLQNINALQPSYTIQAEGGATEIWDYKNKELVCPGASFRRHRIKQRGLLQPHYHGSPVVVYVVQGQATYGQVVSGCPETFESYQQQQGGQQQPGGQQGGQQGQGQQGGQQGQGQQQQFFQDSHQKIERVSKGDIVAINEGVPHWFYNDGNEELVLVVLLHNANPNNQLDWKPRSFLLAGNPEAQNQQPQQQQQFELGNVLRGINPRLLAKLLGVDEQTAQKLQGPNDQRGHIIIIANGLQLVAPPFSQQEQYQNGIEQINRCTAPVRKNIGRPSRADVFNPQAGQWTTVNSQKLKKLEQLGLSVAHGVLFKNALISPRWYLNAHTIIYGIRGQARIQIVNHRGQALFDGNLQQGQVLVLPQNYLIVKEAGNEGFEWVEFNTNDNAIFNTVAGRNSVFRGIPLDVVANSDQISREQANNVKFSRKEILFFSGSQNQGRGRVAAA